MSAADFPKKIAVDEVEAYLHSARSVLVRVFGGGTGDEHMNATVQLASAMVQADASLRTADALAKIIALLESKEN